MAREVVIAFDPATIMGWAVFKLDGKRHSDSGRDERLIESGTWTIRRGDYTGDRWLSLSGKLAVLFDRYRGRVAAVAIERPPIRGKNAWNTASVLFAQLALVEMAAAQACADVARVASNTLKKSATGYGRATKDEVVEAIERKTGPLACQPGGDTDTERERRDKKRSDEADARAAGLWLLDTYDLEALGRGELVAL